MKRAHACHVCSVNCPPFFRRVDKRVGGHRRLSRHSKRARHRRVFGLRPQAGVPLPLRPLCQRYSVGYRVGAGRLDRCCVSVTSCAATDLRSFSLLSCMTGYINNTLSIARMGDHNILNEFSPNQMVTADGLNVSHCRLDLTSTSPIWICFNLS